jgi:biotin carboxyl carrier protein
MRYFVSFGDDEIAVDVTALPAGGVEVRVNGERVDADVAATPDALSVRVGDRMVDLVTEGKLPELRVSATDVRTRVRVESERARAVSGGRRQGAAASGAVQSPMPGRVVKVLVQAGQAVEQEQPVVVVEAMKMENELRAPKAGKIASVAVKAGDRVEAGAMLLQIE